MKILLFFLIVLGTSFTSFQGQQNNKIILAIFAHPDDETAVAPILAKFAKDNTVYLIIATDGRYGIKPGFPTGDSLVNIRQSESECACLILGLQVPIFLGFTDGFDTRNGVGTYLEQSRQLKEVLTRKIEELNPDVVISFGPDGDTGHADHRFIGDIVTEIILKEGWVERFPLYYIAWTTKDSNKFKDLNLNTVHPRYINVSIKYDDESEQKAMSSLECYKSQLSEQEIKEWINTEKNDTTNILNFRQLKIDTIVKSSFFE